MYADAQRRTMEASMTASTGQRTGRTVLGLRAETYSTARTSKTHLALMKSEADADYPPGVTRPKTRAECKDAQRPCAFVSCRHHLYLDVHPKTHSVKVNFPGATPDEMEHTCSLDVADRGPHQLDEVGVLMNLVRERVRQLQDGAVISLARNGSAESLIEWRGHTSGVGENMLQAQRAEMETNSRRVVMQEFSDKQCPECSEIFTPKGPRAKYCSRECGIKFRNARSRPQSPAPARDSEPPPPPPDDDAPSVLMAPLQLLELAGYSVEELQTPAGVMLFVRNP